MMCKSRSLLVSMKRTRRLRDRGHDYVLPHVRTTLKGSSGVSSIDVFLTFSRNSIYFPLITFLVYILALFSICKFTRMSVG